jgi:hypothetical protein
LDCGKKSLKNVSIIIDKLTNSVEDTISGDSFPTELTPLTIEKLSTITKKTAGISIGRKNLKTKKI